MTATRREALAASLPPSLRRLGLTPRKALGQHFLIDEFALSDIADACGLTAASTVLEIGAGPGGLTEELCRRAGRVVAVEIDEELAALTRRRLADHEGLCVVAADALDFTPEELLEECDAGSPYVACGNLPYYITQPLIRRLLEAQSPPERLVITAQKEVAQRLIGGARRESLLSISVRCYGEAELLFDLPAGAFWPQPKVRSSVVRIERLAEPALALPPDGVERFFRVVRAGFSEPRKQLHNALRSALGISAAETEALLRDASIDGTDRAQHLTLDTWRRLHEAVEQRCPATLDVG